VICDSVRGVEEDEVVRGRRRRLDDLLGFSGPDLGAGKADRLDVLPDDAGRPGVRLDEEGVAGTAGEGFQADRARTGVQVEDSFAVQGAAEEGLPGGEEALACAVGGGAGAVARRDG
jgi:hypothetical protein